MIEIIISVPWPMVGSCWFLHDVQVLHTYDYRYQDGYSRQRVAAMYLPLIHYMAAKVGVCYSRRERRVGGDSRRVGRGILIAGEIDLGSG